MEFMIYHNIYTPMVVYLMSWERHIWEISGDYTNTWYSTTAPHQPRSMISAGCHEKRMTCTCFLYLNETLNTQTDSLPFSVTAVGSWVFFLCSKPCANSVLCQHSTDVSMGCSEWMEIFHVQSHHWANRVIVSSTWVMPACEFIQECQHNHNN